MKTLKLHILLYALLAVVLGACSDDDDIQVRPSVSISDVSVVGNKVNLTVTAKNAATCAYVCYKQGETEISTAEVLRSGNSLNINGSVGLTLDNLEWETTYMLKVVAVNEQNESTFCLYEVKTASKGAPMVEIKDYYTENSCLIFTIKPINAVKCAYVYYKPGEQSPSIDEVLSKGIIVDAGAPSVITTPKLDPKTTYIVMVAVESHSGVKNLTTERLATGRDIHGKNLGEGANCYIISEAGDYHFKPLKVDGSEIRGIVNVDWIWTTSDVENSTQQDLLKEVFWANGCVNFTTTGKEGNAIIAGFNKNKQIVWIWQIWCTDQPQTMVYQYGAEFMDRNLGATSADPAEWKKTIGLLWQWGRNVPIFGGYVEEPRKLKNFFSEAQKWTVLNKDYVQKWGIQSQAATIAQSLAAPTTMFSYKNGNWQETYDLSLWGEKKTNYDPCPKGYKMPQTSHWNEFKNSEINKNKNVVYSDDRTGMTYSFQGKTQYWPAGCGRDCYDGGFGFYEKMMVWSGSSELVTNIMYGKIDVPTLYRLTIQMAKGALNYTKTPGNGSFALYVRCVVDK